jgi:hypothetical protein
MSAVENQGSGVRPGAPPSHGDDGQRRPAQDPTWTFAREADELTIVRTVDSDGCALIVVLNETARTFAFRDEVAAVRFQSDMETLLTHTGWSLVGFEPERRVRRDRRTLPRPNERRRWWTDAWVFSGK